MTEFRDPFKASTSDIDDDTSLNSDESDVPIIAFPGHRDTLALLHLKRDHSPALYIASSVPSELLLHIYEHLSPLDFHAARHTCKRWFLASLDKTLLQIMTLRAGCSQAADEDWQRHKNRHELRRKSVERRRSLEHAGQHIRDCHSSETEAFIGDEWLLSKRLATEARITPGRYVEDVTMTMREVLDFSILLPQTPLEKSELPFVKSFTVSSCGKFLLVNCGQIIHVYALWQSITPITSLCCRRSVFAVSMDTSSNRYSVAVLLEGRMGMCWDLDMHAGLAAQEPEAMPEPLTFEDRGVSPEAAHTTVIYEQLGSPDDQPRSVAICPQRKCVAFGCRMGIELHWIDASTGSDLKRWFPLAAPSDFLYFLPQKPSVDPTKKLRLISSAGGPANDVKPRSTVQPSEQSITRLFFGSLPYPSTTTSVVPSIWPPQQGILRTVDCDHYRAIPLSDGSHVLFTDPASGFLCLGSDAPLGGPTKLIRKFMFLPPGYVSTTTKLLPMCYSAAHELYWGVRVAVAYADGSLVLFNIPSDCFNHVKQVRNTSDIWDEDAGVLAQSDLLMDVMMDIQRASEQSTPDNVNAEYHSQTHTHARPLRTIQVPGVKITNLKCGVDDIAVLCQEGGLRIWTFQSSGLAQYWDILSVHNTAVTVSHATRNGLIEKVGKGKARDESKSIHVHFGGIDGSEDTLAKQTPVVVEPKRVAASFIENFHHHHRSCSIGRQPQTFLKDFLCNDELISCLAYRRIVFEQMGSQRDSGSTASSSTRRKSDC